jgi:hypothetical protein
LGNAELKRTVLVENADLVRLGVGDKNAAETVHRQAAHSAEDILAVALHGTDGEVRLRGVRRDSFGRWNPVSAGCRQDG